MLNLHEAWHIGTETEEPNPVNVSTETLRFRTVASATATAATCHDFVLFILSSLYAIACERINETEADQATSESSMSVQQRCAGTVDAQISQPECGALEGRRTPEKVEISA